MKKALVAVALLGLAAGNVAYAQNQPYFGVKGGLMMADDVLGVEFDDALNIGGLVGMKIQDLAPSSGLRGSLAVEGELTLTVIDGDVQFRGMDLGDWDVMTLAGYGVFRSVGDVYFKGKAGLVYQDGYADGLGVNGGSDLGLSLGAGVGFKMGGRNAIEVEYTIMDDLDFLSVGYNF